MSVGQVGIKYETSFNNSASIMKLPSMQCQSPEGNRLWGSSYHTTTNGQVGVMTHQTILYANAGWEEKKLAIVKDKR